jgi:hypothetical protein
MAVDRIQIQDGGVAVHCTSHQDPILCDAVIVAASLGVLATRWFGKTRPLVFACALISWFSEIMFGIYVKNTKLLDRIFEETS